ncbi:hypothetical protein AJ79_03459 [Helicocarpus griseus UAMH5409]|uniref:SGNH hydrolase-type esterase domain-containing protein n=1 Tax=Helicocarpus griseus UAMH5409 TaxID=1447875 RepID=A0A2B7XXK9_9EURO|nr:hypothetical protein AJ79_03459 [Helicocarpus griseus UAMH5409]
MHRLSALLLTLVTTLLVVAEGVNASPIEQGDLAKKAASGVRRGHWVSTWTSMPQLTEPGNLPPEPFKEEERVFFNSTIRQTLHMSIGSDIIRIRFSNAFGTTDLPITAVTVALPEEENGGSGTSTIRSETLQTLTFSGSQNYTIPSGALVVSDPINFPVKPQSVITVSVYLEEGQTTNYITSHPGSRTTSWFSFGNYISAQNLTDPSTQSVEHWYFVSGVEAWSPTISKAFVVVGDSITDGRASDDNKNNRWPDLLLARMQENHFTSRIGVNNQAAGGNRLLHDGLGPNVLSRIDRDVLAQSGVGYAMVFEGVNDIGNEPTTTEAQKAVAERLIAAYKQIITRIHAHGIPVFGATIAPFCAPDPKDQAYSDPTREMARQIVNKWIRTSGAFDAVVDMDKILADPKNPDRLLPKYDSGDYLHPGVAGFQAIADAFPLDIFREFEDGTNSFTKKMKKRAA